MTKKSHTCEERGAHLKISFSYLLINLKNKYLFKKQCCVLKIKKNTWKYHYFTPFTFYYCNNNLDMTYSSRDTKCDTLKLVILGHFCPFTPLKIQKLKFWKNEKTSGDINILHVPKIKIIWCTVAEIQSKTDRTFC